MTSQVHDLIDLDGLSRDEQIDLLERLTELDKRLKYNKLEQWFPDHGPYARSEYKKQILFLEAGALYKERALFGANRVGKTTVAAYEVALHATGLYPTWWKGKRFYGPISIVCLGRSHQAVRDCAQYQLCGSVWDLGTGMIPKHCIIDKKAKSHIPNGLSQIIVQHYSGGVPDGVSTIDFMSYEAGADVLQGTTREVTWEDEENPDPEIHSELVMRTATVDGISICTFTPRKGRSKIVESFLPEVEFPEDNITRVKTQYGWVDRFVTRIDWDDVPHLSDKTKAELLASMQPHEIEARSKGIPVVGVGKVYTVLEADFVVEPFNIPLSWPRCYALDIGWTKTACLWAAIDPYNNDVYIYDEHYVGEKESLYHAYAIAAKGRWIPGVIDPSSSKHNDDGTRTIMEYKSLGLDIVPTKNWVDAGIIKVTNALVQGKLKVFNTCRNFLKEYRTYSRDDNGDIKSKQADHLMDCLRYIYNSGLARAKRAPDEFGRDQKKPVYNPGNRNRITGC